MTHFRLLFRARWKLNAYYCLLIHYKQSVVSYGFQRNGATTWLASPPPFPSAYRFQAYQTSFRKETSFCVAIKSRLFSQTTERNIRVIYLWDNTAVSIAVFLHCSRYKVCRHFEVVGCCRIVAFLTHQYHMIWNRASIRPRDPTDHRQLKRI